MPMLTIHCFSSFLPSWLHYYRLMNVNITVKDKEYSTNYTLKPLQFLEQLGQTNEACQALLAQNLLQLGQ